MRGNGGAKLLLSGSCLMRCGSCGNHHGSVVEVRACYAGERNRPSFTTRAAVRTVRFCARCSRAVGTDHRHLDCRACGGRDIKPERHAYWCDVCKYCDAVAHTMHCSRCGAPGDHDGLPRRCERCPCSVEPCRHELAQQNRERIEQENAVRIARGEIYCRSCAKWSSHAGLHSNCQSQDWRAH